MADTVNVRIAGKVFKMPLIGGASASAPDGSLIRDLGAHEIIRANPCSFSSEHSASSVIMNSDDLIISVENGVLTASNTMDFTIG